MKGRAVAPVAHLRELRAYALELERAMVAFEFYLYQHQDRAAA
jgi:hypothetical protein